MAQTLIDPPQLNNLIGHDYYLFLNKSIDALIKSQTSDTSSSLTTLYQLIQSRVDPPLESIWVYSALFFSGKKIQKDKFSDRVSGLNELFELISMLSASCDNFKSIVLLAPVVYEVHRLIVDVKSVIGELGDKKEKKLMKKIKSLVKSVLGYISVCCDGNGEEPDSSLGSDEFIRPLEDLVRVWIGSENCDGLEKNEIFKVFFPVLGDEVVGVGVSEVVGNVIASALLMRLCLDLLSGVSEQELRAQAVGSITGFRNLSFFETLLRILLEQCLPVTSLLSSENEVSLRKVLFDAVILPEYLVLNPEIMIDVSVKRVLSLSILRVLVTHEATELFRKNGDHPKALSYLDAFNTSRLPSQLVKMVSDKVSTQTEADLPKGMSPKAISKNTRRKLLTTPIEAINKEREKHTEKEWVTYTRRKMKGINPNSPSDKHGETQWNPREKLIEKNNNGGNEAPKLSVFKLNSVAEEETKEGNNLLRWIDDKMKGQDGLQKTDNDPQLPRVDHTCEGLVGMTLKVGQGNPPTHRPNYIQISPPMG